jgi:hypothetical protein
MEEPHRTHKEITFGWLAWLQEFLAKKAQERRERNIAIWGDGAPTGPREPRPDRLYRQMGAIWGARR